MQTKQGVDAQDIYARISQLERRFTMDWYNKGQLLQDLYELRERIHMLGRKHEEIKNRLSDYYTRIDILVDQLI